MIIKQKGTYDIYGNEAKKESMLMNYLEGYVVNIILLI